MNYIYEVTSKLHMVVIQGIRNDATDDKSEVFSMS